MKFNKKIAALLLGGVLAVTGVGVASALIMSSAKASNSGKADSVVILKWGDNTSSDLVIDDITSPVSKQVAIDFSKSTSITGYGVVTFTLAQTGTDSNATYGDVKVSIDDESWDTQDDSRTDVVVLSTISDGTLSHAFEFDLSKTTTTNLYLKFETDGTIAEGTEYSASLTAALSYSATESN